MQFMQWGLLKEYAADEDGALIKRVVVTLDSGENVAQVWAGPWSEDGTPTLMLHGEAASMFGVALQQMIDNHIDDGITEMRAGRHRALEAD